MMVCVSAPLSTESTIASSCSMPVTSLVSVWRSVRTLRSCRAGGSPRTASTQSRCTAMAREYDPDTTTASPRSPDSASSLTSGFFCVHIQLGDVRGAQLQGADVRGGTRRLQQPQRMAGPEPQHPVHPQGGQLLLESPENINKEPFRRKPF